MRANDRPYRTGDFDQLGQILSGVLSARAGSGTAASARMLAEAWPRVVGAEAAANSQPRSIRGGKLVVATSSAGWAQALQEREGEVVARLAREVGLGAVSSVAFRPAGWDPCAGAGSPRPLEADPGAWEPVSGDRVGPVGSRGGSTPSARRELTAKEKEAVEQARRAAPDELLGERIAGAMRASLEHGHREAGS
ncbi:MAG: DciA family protein [Thermoleophilia bacterium]